MRKAIFVYLFSALNLFKPIKMIIFSVKVRPELKVTMTFTKEAYCVLMKLVLMSGLLHFAELILLLSFAYHNYIGFYSFRFEILFKG